MIDDIKIEPLNLDGLVEPLPSPRLTTPHLPALLNFLQEQGLTPGSTTGGRHNVGSKHYSRNAVDIKGSGGFSDAQVFALQQDAASRGFKIRDERVRPPRQKVWGGPHVHLEYVGMPQASGDNLNLDGLVEPLNLEGLTESAGVGEIANAVLPPVPGAQQAKELPQQGQMRGTLHLNPAIAPKVPAGAPRPLAPGEWVDNPDGSWSSEISSTIQNPDGSWSVVPGMWLVNGKPQRVDEDTAARYAQASRLNFPKYKTLAEAEKFATDRESAWQGIDPRDASKIASLWQQPANLTTNDAAWHFGMTPDEAKRLTPKARDVLSQAVAEDQRKRSAGQTIQRPSLQYQNDMRKAAGLKPLKFNVATDESQVSPYYQSTGAPFSIGAKPQIQVKPRPFTFNERDANRNDVRRQVLSEEAQLRRNIAADPLGGRNIVQQPRTPEEINAEVDRRIAEQPTDAERALAAPQIAGMEAQNWFQRQWERGTPEIASFIHKAQATLGRDLSKVMPGGISARLKTFSDQAQSQARVDDLVSQHEYSGDQTLLRGIGKEVVQQAFSLTPMIAGEAATGIPFPVLMAGQSYLENGDKPAGERLTKAGTAYLLGKAYQKLPGMGVKGLQSAPGQIGKLATAYPGIAARVVGGASFGLAGAGETLARGGTAQQALISGVAQAIPGAALAGAPEETRVGVQTVPDAMQARLRAGELADIAAAQIKRLRTMPEIPDVPVGTISEPRLIKGEKRNAINQGQVESGAGAELQGVRPGENLPAYGGEVRQEAGGRPTSGGGAEAGGQVKQEIPLNLTGLVEPLTNEEYQAKLKEAGVGRGTPPEQLGKIAVSSEGGGVSVPPKTEAKPIAEATGVPSSPESSEASARSVQGKEPWEMTRSDIETFVRTEDGLEPLGGRDAASIPNKDLVRGGRNLTVKEFNIARLKTDSGIDRIRPSAKEGSLYLYPTAKGGKDARFDWTAEEKEDVRLAAAKQGFDIAIPEGSGLRIKGTIEGRAHRQAIEKAISEGKPVPPEVLADYPDLAAKVAQQPTSREAPSPPVAAKAADATMLKEATSSPVASAKESGFNVTGRRYGGGFEEISTPQEAPKTAETQPDIESQIQARIKTEIPDRAPQFVKAAKERAIRRELEPPEETKLGKQAGAVKLPQEAFDRLVSRGWDIYDAGVTKFEEWSKKLREEFGPEASVHLKNVWAQLTSPVPDVPRLEDTGIKHAIVEAERELQGLPQFAKARRAHGQSFDEGVYDVQSGRIKPRELASDIVKAFYDPAFSMERFQSRRPRPLSTEESMALLYDRMRISNERKGSEAELEAANEAGDAPRIEKALDEVSRLQQASNANDEADYVAGGEQGRGLAIRREMIKDDYSRSRVLAQALTLNKGKPLPEHITKALEEKVAELAKANERIAELESKQQTASAHSEIEKVIEKTQREVRTQARQRNRQVLDTEAASIKEQIAAAWKRTRSGVQPSGLAGLDPEGELTKLLGMLARNRVEAGISKAADLVDAVHEMVKDVADLTKRDVQDLISGYGKTSKPKQDEIGTKLSELKAIMRVSSGKADVIEKGIRPLRSGFQRPKPTQELREALRDLRDTLREHGIKIEQSARSPEEQQKSILDAAKTTTRNRIEDLTKWIADGKRTVANKTELIPDAELKTLRAERDRLQTVFDAIDDPAANDKAIANALGAVNRSILEMEGKVQSGDVSPKQGATVSPWSEALGKQRQRQVELRKQLEDMRKAARPTPDPDIARIQSALKTASRSIADLQERLRTGNLENTGSKSVPWSPELGKLKQQQAALAKELSDARKAARPAVDKAARAVEQKLKATEKSIANLEQKVRSGSTSTSKVAGPQPTSPELQAARAAQKTLQNILRDMRTAERRAAKPAEDPFVAEARKVLNAQKAFMARNQKQMAAMQKELAEAQRSAKEGGKRPEKAKRMPTPQTDDMRVAKRNANQLRRDIDNVYAVIDWSNKTNTQKVFAYGAAGVRAGVLSGVKVLGKIGGALVQRVGQQYIEEPIGAALSKIVPGSEKAPRHGGGINPKAEADYLRGLASGAMEAPNIILTGESELSLEHGKRYPNIPTKLGTALSVPGRVHAAEKNPLKVAEYNRSLERNLAWAERQGMDRSDPDVIEQAKTRAFKDADEVVLLGDNPITRSLTNMQRGWKDESRSLFKMGVPVAKVPSNYLSQAVGDYGLGFIRGGLRALQQRNPELLEKLTPEEADKTMRLLKRGSLGLIYMALAGGGAGGAITAGGFWSKKKKGERRDVQPGDVQIGPMTISHLWLHSPPDELAQLAGTIRREIENKAARRQSVVRRAATGAAVSAKGTLDQVPFLSRYTRVYDSFRSGDALMKMAGDTLADWVEPQLVQELAKATDREEKGKPTIIPWKGEAVQRKVKTFSDPFLAGLPVARQYLKKDRKKMLEMRQQERRGSTIPPVPGALNLNGLVEPSPSPTP